MKSTTQKWFGAVLIAVFALTAASQITACERTRDTGEQIDETTDDLGRGAEDAGNELEDATD